MPNKQPAWLHCELENAIFTKLGAGAHALSSAFFQAGTEALDANACHRLQQGDRRAVPGQ
jgi:hypothetical protein